MTKFDRIVQAGDGHAALEDLFSLRGATRARRFSRDVAKSAHYRMSREARWERRRMLVVAGN